MKLTSIILSAALVCLFSISMSAQNNYMEVKGSKLLIEGKALPSFAVPDYIGLENHENTYVPAVKEYKAGLGLLISGCVMFVAGIPMVAYYESINWQKNSADLTPEEIEERDLANSLVIAGIPLATVGGAAIMAGVPLLCIGKSRINWCASDYNQKNYGKQVSLNLCSGRNGVGLALNF